MLIEDIYIRLYDENLCQSAYEFSARYLGMSRSYYSVIKTRKEEPSIEAIATLEMALKNKADLLNHSKHPVVIRMRKALYMLSAEVRNIREESSQRRLSD